MPEVRACLAYIAGDIASNYAVDGLILDRIRYPQTSFTITQRDFGYHPDAVARFNAMNGKSGLPDPYDVDWIGVVGPDTTPGKRRRYRCRYG